MSFCYFVFVFSPPLLGNPSGIIYLAILIELESQHLDLGHSKCFLV